MKAGMRTCRNRWKSIRDNRLVIYLAMGAFLAVAGCGEGKQASNAAGAGASPDASVAASGGSEIDGELYAAVNGERRSWYVTHIERDGDWQSGSFWRPMSIANTTQVTIFGLPENTARPTGKGDVMISLTVTGQSGAPRVAIANITYFADGRTKTWTSDIGGDADVVLYRYEFDGEYLDIGGSFSGVVELPDLGNAATQTEAPRRIEIKDGSFAVRVRQFRD